ncbi:MAG: two pore domain potassium channel family protein, partial [Methanobacteriota archaeon]
LQLRISVALLIGVTIAGIAGFMILEGLSFVDALYFCVVTLATVGYGDIHPVTAAGKALSIVLIIGGVGSFVGVVANSVELWVTRREKEAWLRKIGILIGIFYSEVGTPLLRIFVRSNPLPSDGAKAQAPSAPSLDRVRELNRRLDAAEIGPLAMRALLPELRQLLREKRGLLMRLLENPLLFEHEAFTDLLRAIFHLAEELSYREGLADLPLTDIAHLAADAKRAYVLMIDQWIGYMQHLETHYPYLYSLALRTNPFDAAASAIVR